MPHSIAVIIPTYRRWPHLCNTMRDLNRQTIQPDEIVIVDQTPGDEIPPGQPKSLIEGSTVPINYIYQDRPRVYEARNRAAHAASAEILLYIDDDVVIRPEFVERHLTHYSDDAVHAVVGPAVKEGGKLRPAPDAFCRMPPEVQAYLSAVQFPEPIRNVGCMHAGNFSIRRPVLADLGGWDEHVITYGDRDLGIRMARRGYRIDYDPKAHLVHLAAPMGGTKIADPRSPWRSHQRCISIHMLAWRHLWRHPIMFARYGLFRAARFSFLLRRNAIRPWRWPIEIGGYVLALWLGLTWALRGPKCSFNLKS
ncbi:MAG: glycosyltransferase family 2 protein [bacterium]